MPATSANSAKGALEIHDPLQFMVAGAVVVLEDGSIHGRTAEARRLIDKLGLDDPDYVRFRRNWITTIRLAEQYEPDFHRELMAYLDDLPDLSSLRPPGGNSRPEGIAQSHFARRERGELETAY
jgi:hypothetical protein